MSSRAARILLERIQISNASPRSAERSLLRLICLLTVKNLKEEGTKFFQELKIKGDINDDISVEFDDLLGPLKENEISSSVLEAKKLFSQQNFTSSILQLESSFKKIKPVNIQETILLYKKAKDAAKVLEGQDVIILLGGTGVGKSTTIQYLAGMKMQETTVAGQYHIQADFSAVNDNSVSSLKEITSSPISVSETRYITAVPVKYDKNVKLRILNPGQIIICDSPGFLDTSGPEVDIANSLGIIEALRRCNSVRIFYIHSYKSGDKGQLGKKAVGVITSMMTGMKEHLKAFSYGFTKYPPEQVQYINGTFNDLLEQASNSTSQQNETSSEQDFFLDVIDKTQSNPLVINPLEPNPDVRLQILGKLLASSPIKYPMEVFQTFISSDSIAAIQELTYVQKILIESAAKQGNYELVKFRLNELKQLQEIVSQPILAQAIESYTNIVKEILSTKYDDAVYLFNRCFDNGNTLSNEDLDRYSKAVLEMKKADILVDIVGNTALAGASLLQNLKLNMNKIFETLSKLDIDNPDLKNSLTNVVNIANYFPEFKTRYEEACEVILQQFDKIFLSTNQLISSHSFQELAQQLTRARQGIQTLKKIVKGVEQAENKMESTCKFLISYLTEIVNKVDATLQSKLDSSIIQGIDTAFQTITSVIEVIALREFLDIELIKGMKDNLTKKIVVTFDQLTQKIERSLADGESSFKSVGDIIHQVNQLREIQAVKALTTDKYYRITQIIIDTVAKVTQDAEKTLDKILHENNGEIDYDKIRKYLVSLKDADWLDFVREGAYDKTVRTLVQELIRHISKLAKKLNSMELDIFHPENVVSACTIINQAEEMKMLENTVTGMEQIKQFREEISTRFEKSMKSAFEQISKSFSERSLVDQRKELQRLKKIKTEADSKSEEQLYLEKEDIKSVEALQQSIQQTELILKEKKQQAEDRANKLQAEIEQLEQEAANTKDRNERRRKLDASQLKEEAKEKTEKKDAESIEASSKELSRLQGILSTFNKKASSGVISSQAEAYLQKEGYESMENLQEVIKAKEDLVREQELTQRTFDKLDGTIAENAIKYLESCRTCQGVPSVREDANFRLQKMQKYIKDYTEYTERVLSRTFNEITTGKENISQKVETMAVSLKEIVHLTTFPKVNEIVKGQEIIENWRQTLHKLSQTLRVELTDKPSQEKLVMVRSLSSLDGFMDTNFKFFALYSEKQVQGAQDLAKEYKSIIDSIKNQEYETIGFIFSNIKENPMNEQAILRIKDFLTYSIKSLLRSAGDKAFSLKNTLSPPELIRDLIKDLTKLEEAKIFIITFLSTGDKQSKQSDIIETGVDEIKQTINGKIEKFLDQLQAQLTPAQANNTVFEDIETNKEHVEQVCNQLRRGSGSFEDFIPKSTFDKIEQVMKVLEDQMEQRLEQFKTRDFSDYPFDPPKRFIEQLAIVSPRNTKYGNYLQVARKYITDKIMDKLKETKEHPEKITETVEIIQGILPFIPNDIVLAVTPNLKEIQSRHAQKTKNLSTTFESYKTTRDYEGMFRLMNECKTINEELFGNIKLYVLELTRKAVENILASEKIVAVIQELNLVSRIHEIFGKEIHECKSQFLSVQAHLSEKFRQALSFVSIFESQDRSELVESSFTEITQSVINAKYFLETAEEKIRITFSTICTAFASNYSKFKEMLSTTEIVNFAFVQKCLHFAKLWNSLRSNVIQFSTQHPTMKLSSILDPSYEEMKETLISFLHNLQNSFKEVNISNVGMKKTIEKERTEFYKNLYRKIQNLDNVRLVSEHSGSNSLENFKSQVIETIEKQAKEIAKIVLELISKPINSLTKSEWDYIWNMHLNLVALKVNLPFVSGAAVQEIDSKVQALFAHEQKKLEGEKNTQPVATTLIEIKTFGENVPSFLENADKTSGEILVNFKKISAPNEGAAIARLRTELEKDESGTGTKITETHKVFKGHAISKFNLETQQYGISYMKEKVRGDSLDKEALSKRYSNTDVGEKGFLEMFESIVDKMEEEVKSKKQTLEEVMLYFGQQTRSLVKTHVQAILVEKEKKLVVRWSKDEKELVPKLVAHIMALWSLKNFESFLEAKNEENRKSFLMKPHAGQIIAIFRLLGIGYTKPFYKNGILGTLSSKVFQGDVPVLENNLAEIGTGEGKSLVLAVVSSVLALFGFQVSCACYSKYLSERDYNDFIFLFKLLGVTDDVYYGTFEKVCEKILNENGDIRSRIVSAITGKTDSARITPSSRPKILLVDEVDVFFSQDFYGNFYTPLAKLKLEHFPKLATHIWNNKNNDLTLSAVKSTSEYALCTGELPGWEFLVNDAINNMIQDVQALTLHEYEVKDDKIGYKDQDGISFEIAYGYKTMFAYFREHDAGKISRESLEANTFLFVHCGCFSFAEIPYKFSNILGVTGTLEKLPKTEKNIMKDKYNIKMETYIPSVYGERRYQFVKSEVKVSTDKTTFYMDLMNEITHRIKGKLEDTKRAVLVFFESKKELKDFLDSENTASIRDSALIMTEELSTDIVAKQRSIGRATTAGQVTLLTRSFGRGTDFVVRDHQVLHNGGVHVIQTFLSEEKSEEIQIMGRTARQGKDGSFSIILLEETLEKFLSPRFREEIQGMRDKGILYDELSTKREEFFEKQYVNTTENAKNAKKDHDIAERFLEALNKLDIASLKSFLKQYNQSVEVTSNRTLVLMDATGSMAHLLKNAKETVGEMFNRATNILKDSGKSSSFMVQFAVYRDYDCMEEILQFSGWETDPINLRNFMQTITAKGGGDYEESIEIGLWHANREHNVKPLSQVIIIGDAPAKTPEQIKDYRNRYGGDSHWQSKFGPATHYKDEALKLNCSGVKIHSFYAEDKKSVEKNFRELASLTGGSSAFLNVNSKDGAALLTDLVTQEILRVGGGEALVEEYKRRFVKGHV